MKTRMQPIKTIWSKFPRVVRDLSRSCGKSVSVDMEGEGTELDKTIIEAIKDDKAKLTSEAADVLFHLLVMLQARDVPFGDVLKELERREGTSGIAEKAAR